MDFSLAYMKSERQFLLKNFGSLSSRGKLISWEEVSEHSIDGLIFSEELRSNDEFMGELEQESRYLAIRSGADLNLSLEQFEQIDTMAAKGILERIQRSQVLHHNLSLLENLFQILAHLKELYPNDRGSFFEELWFTLRNNLGAKSLRLIYNDVEKFKNRENSGKLIQVLVEGKRHPHTLPGEDASAEIMRLYEKSFGATFEIVNHNPEEGKLVFIASIDQSPLVGMAETFNLSRLQRTLIKSFFDGIQK